MARPKKPPTVMVNVRMPKDIHDALQAVAGIEDRTLAAQIVRILREWLESNDRAAK